MKKKYLPLFCTMLILLASCHYTPNDKAQSAVKKYLKENLKRPQTYQPISFSPLDTLKQIDTTEINKISPYAITHSYSITNEDKEKVTMAIGFYLDKDLKVNEASTKSINGDYGTLTGNVYWKYNNYVGNKPDAGAKITLYTDDPERGNLKYEAEADVRGDYKIEKVLAGGYFAFIRSENVTDCPETHLQKIMYNSWRVKRLFGLDISNYKTQLEEIYKLDSTYEAILTDNDYEKYGGLSKKIDKYNSIETEMRDKSMELIQMFPTDAMYKMGIYSGYSKAWRITYIIVEEAKTENQNTDFGITCI